MQRRLVFVIHSLSGGGAERVLANMANHWSAQGHLVTVVTLADINSDRYRLDSSIERVALGLTQESPHTFATAWNTWRRIRALRSAIRQTRADRVISFTEKINVLVVLATLGMRMSTVICERTDPRCHQIGIIWSTLRRLTYPRCWAAVVQTNATREFVKRLVGAKPVYVVPNAVFCTAAKPTAEKQPWDELPRVCVALSRLSHEKGIDLLLEAVGKLGAKHLDWRINVYGEGQERPRLERLVRERELERVSFLGWTADPERVLASADLFVLPSRFEGFPNALLEAMAAGLPTISFDCESGPREIIDHNVNGMLVPAEDTDALAAAMDGLMSSAEQRQRLGRAAAHVVQRFAPSKFYTLWEDALRLSES